MSIINNLLNTVKDAAHDYIFGGDSHGIDDEIIEKRHKIVTDHPYMVSLGLDAFTTGELYRWWNAKDEKGAYLNQKFFNRAGGAGPPTVQEQEVPTIILLGNDPGDFQDKNSDEGKNQFTFEGWRKVNAPNPQLTVGAYYKFYADYNHTEEWVFTEDGVNAAGGQKDYSMTDVDLDSLTGQSFNSKKTKWKHPNGAGGTESVTFGAISPITEIVNCNEYVYDKEDIIDESLWVEKDFARQAFVHDIIAAKLTPDGKQGYVEWSGYVPFMISTAPAPETINDFDGTGDNPSNWVICEKPDWVKYRLYLYNEEPENARPVTFKSAAIVSKAFHATRPDPYTTHIDGRFGKFSEGDRRAEKVAPMDLTFNALDGKWEGGSKQMVAVIDQLVPAANVLDAETLKVIRTEDMLANPEDFEQHIVWGSGSAIPITQQNANKKQWTPNYQAVEPVNDCGESEDLRKINLTVFNPSTRTYKKDEMVLLNKIDGQWMVIALPSGEDVEVGSAGFEGGWEFSYVATNVVHYFKDSDFDPINYDDIQEGFHHLYYENDDINKNHYGEGEHGESLVFDIQKILVGGYHQFTSFDFVDRLIGGTREYGLAYCMTNPLALPNGEAIESEEDVGDGKNTGTFFGCIFPDGYSAPAIAEYRSDRNFSVESCVAYSGLDYNGEGPWEPKYSVGSIDGGKTRPVGDDIRFDYFNKALDGGAIINKPELPFNDWIDRNDCNSDVRDDDGEIVPMFTDDDNRLSHLPADIALNAGPAGEHGGPLSNLHFIEHMYIRDTAADPFESDWKTRSTTSKTRDFFQQGQNWLYRKYEDDTAGVKTFVEESAFDFKPIRPNKIMFRPLKLEAYAQFGMVTPVGFFSGHTDVFQPADVIFWPGIGRFADDIDERYKRREETNATACFNHFSFYRPCSKIAHKRELEWDRHVSEGGFQIEEGHPSALEHNLRGNIMSIHNDLWGLQYSTDIPYDKNPFDFDGGGAYNTRFKVQPFALLPESNRFHRHALGRERNRWMHGGIQRGDAWIMETNPPWRGFGTPTNADSVEDQQRGCGAVGVIGAVCTTKAFTKIIFDSEYSVGLRDCRFFDNVQGNVFRPCWGGRNGYKDFTTTTMHVKIFHAHPREATIYDPRYFAVHHFNEGIISYFKDDDGKFLEYYVPREIMTINQLYKEDDAAEDDPPKYKEFVYEVDRAVYACDTKIPTVVEINPKEAADLKNPQPDEINRGQPCDMGDLVFGDGVNRIGTPLYMEGVSYKRWLKDFTERDWTVDPDRRGRLLPYKYRHKTITGRQFGVVLPYNEGVYERGGYAVSTHPDGQFGTYWLPNSVTFEFIEDPFDPDGPEREFWPKDYNSISLIVRNPGKGYKVGDTLTVATNYAGGYEAIVAAVDEDIEGDSNGYITGLEVFNPGSGFAFNMFPNSGVPMTRTSTGKVKLIDGGSSPTTGGEGFEAFLTQGVVATPYQFHNRPSSNNVLPDVELIDAVDKKPGIATGAEFTQLAPRSIYMYNNPAEQDGYNQGTDITEVDITANPSADDRYDIFFHYHNDISHTYMTDMNFNGGDQGIVNAEQYHIVEIKQE